MCRLETGLQALKQHCDPYLCFQGHVTMDSRPDSLVMTVHLLAKAGHALLLQQALNQLQAWICLDVHLFLVSERTSPVKYYETSYQRRPRFPGMSIMLFLHEDLGEERIFQVHDFFQRPPWHHVYLESASGKRSPHVLVHQDFYGLDEHMPVWGVRQVHYGTEILRITVYCSFDNYCDAVRLYEMILQKEATLQKSSFCAFVLYTTNSTAVQLCLKQLPLGMSIDSKESSVLQFKVHEIGQLVPLLPNPCVPISSTRWQTEDYEGNKILLQVQGSSKHSGSQGSLSSWPNNASEEGLVSYSSPSPLATRRTTVQQKTRTLRAMKNKSKPIRAGANGPGSLCSPLQSCFCSSLSSCSLAASSLQDLGPAVKTLGATLRHSSHELWLSRGEDEEETNVDTGSKVVSSDCDDSPLNSFSRDLQSGLPQSPASCSSLISAGSRISLHSEDRKLRTLHIAKINKGSELRGSGSLLGLSRTSPAKDEEEEFFI